jgi:hypothetical protein
MEIQHKCSSEAVDSITSLALNTSHANSPHSQSPVSISHTSANQQSAFQLSFAASQIVKHLKFNQSPSSTQVNIIMRF